MPESRTSPRRIVALERQCQALELRYTATKLRREHRASIEDVSAFLGHRSIATTARYLARLEGEQDNGWQGVAQSLGVP